MNIVSRVKEKLSAAFTRTAGKPSDLELEALGPAVAMGNTDAITTFLDKYGNGYVDMKIGSLDLLMHGVLRKNAYLAEKLLARGATVHREHMERVVIAGDFSFAEKLLEFGGSAQDALVYANTTNGIKWALKHGGNIQKNGDSLILHLILGAGSVVPIAETLKALAFALEAGADKFLHNQCPATGNTFLMDAAEKGVPEIVEFLISRNVDVHVKNADGTTALMFAKNGMKEAEAESRGSGQSYARCVKIIQSKTGQDLAARKEKELQEIDRVCLTGTDKKIRCLNRIVLKKG